ncbi:MAG: hypothetical protein ACU0DW_04140 [Shimia sp.]
MKHSLLGGLCLALITTTAANAQDCSDGQRLFEHAAGETCIPEDPQRIVTLSDQNALLPLLELGVRPVGSTGRVLSDGSEVFRRTQDYDTLGMFLWELMTSPMSRRWQRWTPI